MSSKPAPQDNQHKKGLTSRPLPVPSGPNSAPTDPHTTNRTFHPHPDTPTTGTPGTRRRHQRRPPAERSTRHDQHHKNPNSQCSTHEHTTAEHMPAKWLLDPHAERDGHELLRKEVIQPHLPVRLPCYDFVPIADPTFDGSLPTRGLGHRLRVLPTFVT